MFKYTDLVMRLTPIGVFGAMAYNVSHMASGHVIAGEVVKGWPAVGHLLAQYARVVGSLYFSLALLVVAVFVPVMFLARVPVRRFLSAVRDPAMTAFSSDGGGQTVRLSWNTHTQCPAGQSDRR